MGAVNFSLDYKLVIALKAVLPLNFFVETGTFKGDSLDSLRNDFDSLYSIELSPEYFAAAKNRFAGISNINLKLGESVSILNELSIKLKESSVLYFLDAHWCVASHTAGETSQCPLLGEIRALESLNSESIIIIDDARLFLAAPLYPHEISQWPTFNEVISELHALSSVHEIAVVNDVIIYHPKSAINEIRKYSQKWGFDWHRAALSISNDWLEISEKKEQVIQDQISLIEKKEQVIQDLISLIEKKEELIQNQSRTIKAYMSAYGDNPIRAILVRIVRRVKELIRPRVGCLNQYSPRELDLNAFERNHNISSCLNISVVTPSFNQGRFIESTILSVIKQSYPNIEYIIMDGASSDNTVNILEKYQNSLKEWVSEPDSGQSNAINKGMLRTTGEIMCWLNSDDLLLPGALHTVVSYFDRHPDVDIVYGNRLMIDENGMEIGRWVLPGHDNDILSWADYIPQETLFWRRRVWDKVGAKIDESYSFAMDWDLLVRFRDVGAKFAHIPQFLGAFRIHEHQKTSVAINEIGNLEMTRIRERTLGKVPSRREIHKALLPYLAKHVAVDLIYRVKKRLGVKT